MAVETDTRPEVRVHVRRVTSHGQKALFEGFAVAAGKILHRTGRVQGFGAKSLALARAIQWAQLHGLRPVTT